MTEESVFKPVSRSPVEDPRTNIDPAIAIEIDHSVAAINNDYLMQIAEQEGLQSCLPTSLLNGLVHLGVISTEQAATFQRTLTTENRDLFSKRTFGESTLEVMAAPTSILLDRIKKTLGVEFKHQVIGVKSLSSPELISLIQQKLMNDSVVVGGDQNHAVLMIGYDRTNSIIKVIDPYQPQTQVEKPLPGFVDQIIRSGEPWLTVLSK